ncbi:MAG: carbohydrate deacetylase [Bryobacteraceae bacterium]
MSRSLIINGDDFGLTEAVTDGIFQAHKDGVLTSASLIVNQPATEYAVGQLSRYPGLGVGIHLNLSRGKPVLPRQAVPSLVGSGGDFLSPEEMQSRLMRWNVCGKEVEAEYRAQIRLARALGVNPTHADSHHHMHLFFAAVIPFRKALEVEGIRSIRACRIRQWPSPRRIGGPHSGNMLRRLGVLAYMEFLAAGPLRPFHAPICRIETRRGTVSSSLDVMVRVWTEAFQNLNVDGVFELVCHPGLEDPERRHTDRIHDKRISDLNLLTAPRFKELFAEFKIDLTSYVGLVSGTAATYGT